MNRTLVLAAGVMLAAGGAARGDAPDALSAVPPSAAAFVYAKPAELARTPLGRAALARIPAADLAAFGERFRPRPAEVASVALFWPGGQARVHRPIVALTLTRPVDGGDLRALLPDGVERGRLLVSEEFDAAAGLLSADTLVYGPTEAVESLTRGGVPARGALGVALTAARNEPLTVALSAGAMRELLGEGVPDALARALAVTLSLSSGDRPRLRAGVLFLSAAEAADGRDALAQLAREASLRLRGYYGVFMEGALFRLGDTRQGGLEALPAATAALFARGGVEMLRERLEELPLAVSGPRVTLETDVPPPGVAALALGAAGALGVASVPDVLREPFASGGRGDANKFKQILIALHAYHDVNGRFPADTFGPDGRPLLSWRVQLLPYLEQDALARSFRLDEPWDGPTNRPLIEQMPDLFRLSGDPKGGTGTRVRGLTGDAAEPGAGPVPTLFGGATRFADVSDGLSNTIAIVEAREAVPWTKPGTDVKLTPGTDAEPLGRTAERPFVAGMADGSVARVRQPLSRRSLGILAGVRDGQVTPAEWDERTRNR